MLLLIIPPSTTFTDRREVCLLKCHFNFSSKTILIADSCSPHCLGKFILTFDNPFIQQENVNLFLFKRDWPFLPLLERESLIDLE